MFRIRSVHHISAHSHIMPQAIVSKHRLGLHILEGVKLKVEIDFFTDSR